MRVLLTHLVHALIYAKYAMLACIEYVCTIYAH